MSRSKKIAISVLSGIVLAAGLFLLFYFLVLPNLQKEADPQTGLVSIDGNTYYYDDAGLQQYGWQTIEGKLYYFDPVTGVATRGWFTDADGSVFYFGEDGAALTGSQTIDGQLRDFGTDGKLVAGAEVAGFTWQVQDGKYYCVDENGNRLTGLQEVSGALYYFDEDGVRQSGWQTIDGKLYYFNDQNGRGAVGWLNADDGTYYFGSDGFALTGEATIDGIKYSFGTDGRQIKQQTSPVKRPTASSSSSKPADTQQPAADPPAQVTPTYSWQTVDGKKYYQDQQGNKKKGPTAVGGSIYCLDASTGEVLYGWVLYGDTRYYADETTGIAKTSAWMTDPNDKNISYYLGGEGYALTGMQVLSDGSRYLFDSKTGAQKSGLQLVDSKLYYFAGEKNAAVSGWHTVSDTSTLARAFAANSNARRYYFTTEHYALSGVVEIDGKWYGFSEDDGVNQCVQLTGWQDIDGKRYCFEGDNGSALISTAEAPWHQHAEGQVYLGAKGAAETGLLELGDEKYYLNSMGVRQKGWATINGAKYCFAGENDAALRATWQDEPEVGRCYLGEDGAAYTGARVAEGVLYGFGPDGALLSGWQTLNGKLYLLNEAGAAQFGWQKDGEKHLYLHDTEGYALTGLATVGGKSYYFNTTTGVREGGWKTINGKLYLFDGTDQQAITGEHIDGANIYYFGTDGAAQTGVVPVGQHYYYHNKNGVRMTGWQTDGTYRYYFDEGTGRAATGWFTDVAGGGVYYFDAQGRALTGSQKLDGRSYKFDAQGRMIPDAESSEGNWVNSGGATYFVGPDGNYVKGLQTIEGALYYFNTSGAMQKGWVTAQNRKYYFDPETGKAVSGWFTDPKDATRNYFFGSAGSAHVGLLRDTSGDLYYFGADGVQKFGDVLEDGHRYYFEAANKGKAFKGWYPSKTDETVRYYGDAGYALTGLNKIEEDYYLFNDDGIRQSGWHTTGNGLIYCFGGTAGSAIKGEYTDTDGKTYCFTGEGFALVGLQWLSEEGPLCYFDNAGVRQTGWQRIGGLRYYFNSSGQAVFGEFSDPEGSGTYYFAPEGYALTGVHEMEDGRTYVFDTDGRMISKEATTGYEWKTVDGKLYYTNSAGEFYTGLTPLGGALYHFHDGGQATIGWHSEAGKKYFFGTDGKAARGWMREGEKAYYFGTDGYALTGEQTIDEVDYEFNAEGELTSGTVPVYNQWEETEDGARYYDSTGKLAKGVVTIDGEVYYFDADGYRQSGWHSVDGSHYHFGADGKAAKGWAEIDKRWFCFDESTARQLVEWQYRQADDGKTYAYYYDKATGLSPAGWVTVAGASRYFYPEGGHMATGWSTIEGDEYYFFSNGERATGVVTIEGKLYSFDSDGKALTGWNTGTGGKRYYFKDGEALTGWNQIEGDRWVLFDKDTAELLSGWQTRTDDDGTVYTYYYDSTGKAPLGWGTVSGIYRYFYPDGHMAVGWNTIEKAVYHFSRNGQMATGTATIEGVQYAFGEDGKLTLGWATADGSRYYYTANGAARGWQKVEDIWYSFDEETGAQLLGQQVRMEGDQSYTYEYRTDGSAITGWDGAGANRRWFAADGEMAVGWKTVEGKEYYFRQDGRMATGVVEIEGEVYSFDAEGQLQTGWNTDSAGNRYYFTAEGAAKGWEKIDGLWYRFDETTAAQLTGWQMRPRADAVYDAWHYFFDNGQVPERGWNQEIGGKQRYVKEDGEIAVFWATVEGKRHYFLGGSTADTLGVPASGWLKAIDNCWYNFGDRGQVLTGWQERTVEAGVTATYYYFEDGTMPAGGWNSQIENTRRYIMSDGEVPSNLLTSIDGYTYYLETRGVPATGKRTIGGKEYIFDDQGRHIAPPAINSVTFSGPNGNQYTVNVGGVASSLLADKTLMYSFDNGNTWQSSGAKAFTGGTVIAKEHIQIKDSAGNIAKYGSAVTVPSGWGQLHGIDVSSHQGYINWAAVAASGKVDFAIIRSVHWPKGGSWYAIDPYFDYNVREAKKYGIKVGTYLYSYAFKESEMAQEINFFFDSPIVKKLFSDGIYFDLPIYIDYEDKLLTENTSSNKQRTDIVRHGMVLIEQISRARYGKTFTPGFYTYRYFPLDKAQLQNEGYDFWLAHYDIPAHGWSPTPGIWQYSSKASIPGITGNVDVNHLYKDYSYVNPWGGSSGGSTGSGGTSGSGSASTGTHPLTVTNQSGTKVTGPANEILAQIVSNEVRGFANDEVYKAQAVAAQAWILYQNSVGKEAPQVGLYPATAQIQNAVNQVAGKNLKYNGAQAFTPYYAYSNGTTNDNTYWGNGLPYLQSVPSTYDTSKGANTATITVEQLKAQMRAIYKTDANGKYPYDYYPDPASWIQIKTVNGAGYVTKVEICGRKPSTDYFYQTLVRNPSSAVIYSPSFTYTYANGVFTFTSRGWGHGVGMSQTGAYGLANQNGYNYTQILSHYFPGTTLVDV